MISSDKSQTAITLLVAVGDSRRGKPRYTAVRSSVVVQSLLILRRLVSFVGIRTTVRAKLEVTGTVVISCAPLAPVAQVRSPLRARLVQIYVSPFKVGDSLCCVSLVARMSMQLAVQSHRLCVGRKRTAENDKFPGRYLPQCPYTIGLYAGLYLGSQWK